MQNFPLNLLTFPMWWYTVGSKILWSWNKRQWHFGLHKTGLLLFSRHMGEPLYGDYTKSGRVLSFFLRLFLLFFKLIALSFRLIFLAIIDVLFVLVLPAIISMVIVQIFQNA